MDKLNEQKIFTQKVKNIFKKEHKYFLYTFGCQMNENDSEKIAGMLKDMGYVPSAAAEHSDIIIFNTCCVREHAEEKVYGYLGALKRLHTDNPDLIIAVCGCMVQQKEVQSTIKEKYKHIDLVFGTHNLYKLPELLFNVLDTRRNIIDVWDAEGNIVEGVSIERKSDLKSWVTIMYGCDNFCTYCIVPYVRGRERSRKPSDIIEEIEELAAKGIKEITLLGQNVNSYKGGEAVLFPELLEMINRVSGIERIRFMTSHPKDLSQDLITAMRNCNKVCKHLHLPMQSGSSKILKEMNRKYTKEYYLELIEKIKKEIPEITLSTDIIVGFPGETEQDFQDTLDVVNKARFDAAYTFLYSKRTGTPAAGYDEQVPEDTAKERFNRLLALQSKICREKNEEMRDTCVEVLCEGASKNNPDMLTGRTDGNKIVNFSGDPDLYGRMMQVRITNVQTWSLEGEINKH